MPSTGEYKATLRLDGVTICNPDSSAIHVKNGKRIKVSMTANTVNTLSDGVADTTSKGCFHSKGHTEFVGKGTLNVSSNYRHAIFSKEYVEIKNCTLNITGAKKDGIHCQEYLLMSSGTVNISGVEDDGIQVELKDYQWCGGRRHTGGIEGLSGYRHDQGPRRREQRKPIHGERHADHQRRG